MPGKSTVPVAFFGHGSPMNAVEDNEFTRSWKNYAKTLPPVKGVLCISAHWYTRGTGVTAMTTPRTIHDFAGFPEQLYRVHYSAPGDPNLAEQVASLLANRTVVRDQNWGIDHGAWSVLIHMFPDADIPVVQLSIDASLDPQEHFEIGKTLTPLREAGIFILGSGNVVHNLRATFGSKEGLSGPPLKWNVDFNNTVVDLLTTSDEAKLINYHSLGSNAQLSIPTPDHYLPLLYVLGAKEEVDSVSFPTFGYSGAGISMLSASFG